MHNNVQRTSSNSIALRPDHIEHIDNLTIKLIRHLCTYSDYVKAKIYREKNCTLISTIVDKARNNIAREFRSALIYDQSIRWGGSSEQTPITLNTISVFSSSKYFNRETVSNGLCCKHIIGQLRRVVYLSS